MEEVSFLNGPDQVLPATSYTTIERTGSVKLKIPESGTALETIPPKSVPTLIYDVTKTFPNHTAYAFKKNEKWNKVTYSQFLKEIRTCAKAFLHLGLEKLKSVCIIGFNSPEWVISYLGSIFAGGIAVGVYSTNSSEACYYCAETSKANIIVVEDQKQLEKILAIRDRLPELKTIIQYKGEPSDPDVLSWDRLMKIGEQQTDELLDKTFKSIAINECCTIVFTSGTVGNPKAAMLSHDNMTWCATSVGECVPLDPGNEAAVSFLPLSHVAAQIVDIFLVAFIGGALYFADKDALKGTLINTLKEVQPTKFVAVPRVWEKIHEKMMSIADKNGYIKKAIGDWAKSHALLHNMDKMKGINSNSWGYTMASALILKKVKEALGLNRCTLAVSAAAPISPDLKKYFLSLDILIMEVFGMSECSGPHTMSTQEAFDLDSIGRGIPGSKTKMDNIEDGQGELCMTGRHIFMGYLNEKGKTDESLDEKGWLHSGDLGRMDSRGMIYITGRSKEIIITAGGENVAPVPIEQQIKNELNHVSQVFLVGDKRKFLSVLFTLKTDVDSETAVPLDTLSSEVKEWLRSLECPAETLTEVLKAGPDPKLLKALHVAIDKINTRAISNAQKIQKIAILPADFSIPTGEFGPTLKVKRKFVLEKYNDIIESLYDV